MIYVRIIDSNGLFVCDAFVDELTEFTIEAPCPDGFYLPKWDGSAWVEGKTAEEIAAIVANVTTSEPTADEQRDLLLAQLQEDNKTLKAQLSASIQSNQTLEDCLVEMASVVYA